MKHFLLAILLFSSLGLAMATDTVTVPPGHKVVVMSPTATPHISRLASGPLAIDYGTNGDWRAINLKLRAFSQKPPQAVVILQNEMIEALAKENRLDEFFADWKTLKAQGVNAIWVLPLRASAQTSVIGAIHRIGYSVHTSASDGACYVEVHKPDGSIMVGMAGAAL